MKYNKKVYFSSNEIFTSLYPEFIEFIKDFELKVKRIQNFNSSKCFITARNEKNDLIGIIFVNTRFVLLNNTTWLVLPAYRKCGIASELISLIKSKYTFLVAYTRNQPSSNLARKMDFFVIASRFCFWFRFLT
jgi:hypothetical protein